MLDLEPMTLSRHIDRMEEAGLVERRPDPTDRRARQLFTTGKGRELLSPMRARAAAIYEQVQAGLSAAERVALVAALETIIRNLSAAEDRAAPEGTDRPGSEKELDDRPDRQARGRGRHPLRVADAPETPAQPRRRGAARGC